jgi:hypothetical protein
VLPVIDTPAHCGSRSVQAANHKGWISIRMHLCKRHALVCHMYAFFVSVPLAHSDVCSLLAALFLRGTVWYLV